MVSSATRSVWFIGSISNTAVLGGVNVQLSGVASGSATTASNGSFSVQLTASGLGTETAATTDASAQTTLTDPAAPLISSFNSTEYQGGYVLFKGQVNGTVSQGEQITFAGSIAAVMGQTTTVNADGSFSFVEHFQAGTDGTVTATATADAWGVNNTASNTINL